MMSFSAEVKKELCAVHADQPCCMAAETYGLLEYGHAFSAAQISLYTEQNAVAHLYLDQIEKVCGVRPIRQETLKHNAFHIVTVSRPEERKQIFDRFGHDLSDITVRFNRANLECDACPSAYLRGAFLSCGAVTNPSSDYHLEFSVPYFNLSRDLLTLLLELGLSAKMIRRKGSYVVYLKESEQIEDCLTMMGAVAASLELMNVKIVKDIRNTANRITNCESANIDKTVAAAAVQIEAVRKISRCGGLQNLPKSLREIAQLRLDNPDMSLRELGENLTEPLSRSGVNHRLRRIVELADKL